MNQKEHNQGEQSVQEEDYCRVIAEGRSKLHSEDFI